MFILFSIFFHQDLLLNFAKKKIFLYHFSYYVPFTNNGFVVANVRPVAANVNGYITDIYVKNEARVNKGQPLFTVFRKPYLYAYMKAKSDVKEAKAYLRVLITQLEKTKVDVDLQIKNLTNSIENLANTVSQQQANKSLQLTQLEGQSNKTNTQIDILESQLKRKFIKMGK